jgi:hypothetical protein
MSSEARSTANKDGDLFWVDSPGETASQYQSVAAKKINQTFELRYMYF